MLGHGCTTGHQNRSEVVKKDACSTSCQNSERSANSKAGGECHAIRVTAAASQQKTGCVRTCPNHCTGCQRKSGPKTARTKLWGNPCSSGKAGAPSKINGGATAIRRMCCTI